MEGDKMNKLPSIYWIILLFSFALGSWTTTFFHLKKQNPNNSRKFVDMSKEYRERTIEIRKQNELTRLFLKRDCEIIPTKICKEIK
jgi:hypothetical protein